MQIHTCFLRSAAVEVLLPTDTVAMVAAWFPTWQFLCSSTVSVLVFPQQDPYSVNKLSFQTEQCKTEPGIDR
jgi:hypothetical protein